ncbi:TRAP transporter substrate-binding protein [Rhodoferax sediminis]|jgi:tripartite ATP-independent transporter DctP family solute receptor|uniref:TRAP transporter substrate-binding protein n=1 Tax=Rhodoferax sediminis TaxID=2509614 RepID=A0A515D938_9BURK|nr:TRAP transporter substrate-binding protein [Rhodoferax sediminis]
MTVTGSSNPTITIPRRTFIQGAAGIGALACIGQPVFAQTAEFTLKWANNIPATHPSTIRIREAADAIKKETNGRVDIQVFPNNQLGGDTDMLSQVRSGAIDIFPLSGLILQTLVPVAGINGLAFAFKDYPTVWAAMDGDLGTYIRGAIDKVNLHTFDKCLDNGYRNITTSTKPINTAADLKGFKIRVPVSPLWTSMFKAFGAAPTGINFSEVYSALQTKVVEGQENPLAIIEIAKLYEVQKYCSMTRHMWDGQWILANGKRWNSLPRDIQAVINKNVALAVEKQRDDIRRLDNSVEAQLKAKGMIFNDPDPKSFRETLSKAGFYQDWRKKFGDEAMSKLEKYSGKLA